MELLKKTKNVTSNGTILGTGVGKNRFVRERLHIGIQHRKNPANTKAMDLLIFIYWMEILVCVTTGMLCRFGATSKL